MLWGFCSFNGKGFYDFVVFEVFVIFKILIGIMGFYTTHPDRPHLAPLLALAFLGGFDGCFNVLKMFLNGKLWNLKGFMGFLSSSFF